MRVGTTWVSPGPYTDWWRQSLSLSSYPPLASRAQFQPPPAPPACYSTKCSRLWSPPCPVRGNTVPKDSSSHKGDFRNALNQTERILIMYTNWRRNRSGSKCCQHLNEHLFNARLRCLSVRSLQHRLGVGKFQLGWNRGTSDCVLFVQASIPEVRQWTRAASLDLANQNLHQSQHIHTRIIWYPGVYPVKVTSHAKRNNLPLQRIDSRTILWMRECWKLYLHKQSEL